MATNNWTVLAFWWSIQIFFYSKFSVIPEKQKRKEDDRQFFQANAKNIVPNTAVLSRFNAKQCIFECKSIFLKRIYFNISNLQHIQRSTTVKKIFQFRLHALYISLSFVKWMFRVTWTMAKWSCRCYCSRNRGRLASHYQ